MSPITEQLAPDHLSFAFPNGLGETGTMRFDALEQPTPDGRRIPLVEVPSLGYGYTASLLRIEYFAADALIAMIGAEADGVYYEQGNARTRIADEAFAFFDTGTTVPMLPIDGDISLLSDETASSLIESESAAPLYDSFRLVFRNALGEELILDSGEVTEWSADNPFARVLTPPAVPAGLSVLTVVAGLNFIGQFDFQFEFDGGVATDVTFIER